MPLPPPDGSSHAADALVWVCPDCDQMAAYHHGDVLKFEGGHLCANGHRMLILRRDEFKPSPIRTRGRTE